MIETDNTNYLMSLDNNLFDHCETNGNFKDEQQRVSICIDANWIRNRTAFISFPCVLRI